MQSSMRADPAIRCAPLPTVPHELVLNASSNSANVDLFVSINRRRKWRATALSSHVSSRILACSDSRSRTEMATYLQAANASTSEHSSTGSASTAWNPAAAVRASDDVTAIRSTSAGNAVPLGVEGPSNFPDERYVRIRPTRRGSTGASAVFVTGVKPKRMSVVLISLDCTKATSAPVIHAQFTLSSLREADIAKSMRFGNDAQNRSGQRAT